MVACHNLKIKSQMHLVDETKRTKKYFAQVLTNDLSFPLKRQHSSALLFQVFVFSMHEIWFRRAKQMLFVCWLYYLRGLWKSLFVLWYYDWISCKEALCFLFGFIYFFVFFFSVLPHVSLFSFCLRIILLLLLFFFFLDQSTVGSCWHHRLLGKKEHLAHTFQPIPCFLTTCM